MFNFSGARGETTGIDYFFTIIRSPSEQYYSQGEVEGLWLPTEMAHGWKLSGTVAPEVFVRLARGQHPFANDWKGEPIQLIQKQDPTPYIRNGKLVTPMEHRAYFDLTVGCPKSGSVARFVGFDPRIEAIHNAAADKAVFKGVEPFAQARPGGDGNNERDERGERKANAPIVTRRLLIAVFTHGRARPVNGYAAPHLHNHYIAFNMTTGPDGKVRALQTWEMFVAQELATAIYRTEFMAGMRRAGYEMTIGPSGEPTIVGFTQAYLDASSPRRLRIVKELLAEGRSGAKAAQIVAHQTREAKIEGADDVMREQDLALADVHGNQARAVVETALARGPVPELSPAAQDRLAEQAIDYAIANRFERQAVVDERGLLADGLSRSMGLVPMERIERELALRKANGRLIERSVAAGSPSTAWTTPAMIALEQENIARMLDGHDQHPPMLTDQQYDELLRFHPILNEDQQAAGRILVGNHDTDVALDAIAGSGKTTLMRLVVDAGKQAGYRVQGIAPTTTAAAELAKAGMETQTIQRHVRLAASGRLPPEPTLYILSEGSMTSTPQMHTFLTKLRPHDRWIVEGDHRQHQAVQAGRPFDQLIGSGLQTATLHTIVRQKDDDYRRTVERAGRGDIAGAVDELASRDLIVEIPHQAERLRAVSDDYAAKPEKTIVVAPDNDSRRLLNETIHVEMGALGVLTGRQRTIDVLVERQDLTDAKRGVAALYEAGNRIRFSNGSGVLGIPAGGYVTVLERDPANNRLKVVDERDRVFDYDPKRHSGVSVYRTETREFSAGDRIQFTQPFRDKGVANGDVGTILAVTGTTMRVRLDGKGPEGIRFGLNEYRHLDYGYAVTTYKAQGKTSHRVLFHINTDHPAAVDRRAFFVAISRGEEAIIIYTDCADDLARVLSRDNSQRSAIEHDVMPSPRRHQQQNATGLLQ